MNAATSAEQLVKSFIKEGNWLVWDRTAHTADYLSNYSQPIRNAIEGLLRSGADPNTIICGYSVDGHRLHRSLTARAKADFLEGPYNQKFGTTTVEKRYPWRSIGERVARKNPELNSHLGFFHIPLLYASARTDTYLVKLLIQFGARFDHISKHVPEEHWERLMNPFYSAAMFGDLDFLKFLIGLMDLKNPLVQKWLDYAALEVFRNITIRDPDLDVVTFLFKHGSRIPKSLPPHLVLSPNIALKLLSHERSDLLRNLIKPPIFGAAYLDSVQLCAEELRDGTDVTARDAHGLTALHIAVGNVDSELCKYLVFKGADVNARDNLGVTPLLEAVYYGHTKAVACLLQRGANVNDRVNDDETVYSPTDKDLNVGVGVWNEERNLIFRRFLEWKWSALHIAASRGLSSVQDILIVKGADLACRDSRGASALDIAIQNQHWDAAFQILNKGGTLNAQSSAASNFLEKAIEKCRYDVAVRLFHLGVSPPDGFTDFQILDWDSTKVEDQTFRQLRLRTPQGDTFQDEEPSKLCDQCINIIQKTSRKFGYPLSLELVWWTKYQSCHLCRLFYDLNNDTNQGSSSEIVATFQKNKDTQNHELVININQKQYHHLVKLIPDDWHDSLQAIDALEDPHTGSLAAQHMAKKWLQSCIHNHKQCNASRRTQYSPTRVVDIKGLQDGRNPRLVQHPALEKPYIALSHRWGTEGLPVTTLANLDSHLNSIPLTSLSQTMQDAIKIANDLGYRYLWVDALCIIQDSQEDWLSEASKMSSVFSGAVLTIAVADAVDHSQGIFRPRRAQCLRPFKIDYLKEIPHRDRTSIDGEGKFYVFPNTDKVQRGARPKGPLDSRGWVLQEQLLSPRLLYYGQGELFWDCITVSASESSPLQSSLLIDHNPDETWALKFIRKTIVGSSDTDEVRERLQTAWNQAIRNYSARQLTKDVDKLIALEGILQAVAPVLEDIPIAGMWHNGLSSQLLWWQERPSPRLLSSEKTFSAPSWSWLSAKGPVQYHNSLPVDPRKVKNSSNNFVHLGLFSTIHIAECSTNAQSTSIDGLLCVTGYCFSYTLTETDFKKPIWKRWNQAKLKVNAGRWMLDTKLELPLEVQCLIMAEDEEAKVLVCLCLVPAENDPTQWKRVGLCHWEGIRQHIGGFVGKDPELDTVIIV